MWLSLFSLQRHSCQSPEPFSWRALWRAASLVWRVPGALHSRHPKVLEPWRDTNSKETSSEEEKQTTVSPSETPLNSELLKGVWYRGRKIVHSKSRACHVIKEQMSLGRLSSLCHSIIRIAACQELHLALSPFQGQERHFS